MTDEQEIEMQAAVTNAVFGVYIQHRHNPQLLLLTDQRSPEKKIADAYVAQYREAFPDLLKMFTDRPLGEVYDHRNYSFPTGGTITGRLPRDPIPYLEPGGEFVVSARGQRGRRSFVDVDFGVTEARVLATMVQPKVIPITQTFKVDTRLEGIQRASKSMEGFAARMALHARAVSRMNDKMILMALFGDINLNKPEPGFAYERRLAKLLKSRDPRQRKRGERLFKTWYRTHKGMNLYRGYSGK